MKFEQIDHPAFEQQPDDEVVLLGAHVADHGVGVTDHLAALQRDVQADEAIVHLHQR